MEFNKNKLIIAIIALVLVLFSVFVFTMLQNRSKNTSTSGKSDTLKVWIYQDSVDGFSQIFDAFKKTDSQYANISLEVESFHSYEDYMLSLSKSFLTGEGPDLFVLNNNETNSLVDDQIQGISPNILDPNQFRKQYKGVFSDDLILSSSDAEGTSIDFLKGIPVGYETLGIFFNRKYLKSSDIASISSLNNTISSMKKKRPSSIPFGIGNGSSVYDSADIFTQFLMLDGGARGIDAVSGASQKQALANYLLYGDEDGSNGYNRSLSRLQASGENNLDLFSKSEVQMVAGYPRMIHEIEKRGFQKSFLYAEPFPHYFSGSGDALINYNYFVINKDSKKSDISLGFLAYLASEKGAEKYIKTYGYYLPALHALEDEVMKNKIHENYNIILSDFYNDEYNLASFNKGMKYVYDREVKNILDNPVNYSALFNEFKSSILCRSQKLSTLKNLSSICN